MSRRVEDSMADAQRSDDEGCITEDFSDSRGSSETKENIGKSENTLLLIGVRNSRVKLLNKLKLSLR